MAGVDKGTFVIVVAAEERKLMTLKIHQNVKKVAPEIKGMKKTMVSI